MKHLRISNTIRLCDSQPLSGFKPLKVVGGEVPDSCECRASLD